MVARIRAGSLTTASLSATGLRRLTSASVAGSVTVQPWNSRSPVSSSTNTAGQWSLSVSGSIAMNISAMTGSSVASSCADLRDGSSSLALWATRRQGLIPISYVSKRSAHVMWRVKHLPGQDSRCVPGA